MGVSPRSLAGLSFLFFFFFLYIRQLIWFGSFLAGAVLYGKKSSGNMAHIIIIYLCSLSVVREGLFAERESFINGVLVILVFASQKPSYLPGLFFLVYYLRTVYTVDLVTLPISFSFLSPWLGFSSVPESLFRSYRFFFSLLS